MSGKFINHPEIMWRAEPVGGFGLPPLQITINLENFSLVAFTDLRKEDNYANEESDKLRLEGNNKVYIYIKGPDYLIDILYAKLPRYIGRSWSEINKLKLERSSVVCENFLIGRYCNPWIIDKFKFKEFDPRKGISYNNTEDLLKADEICARCNNFKPKSIP